MHPLGFGAQRGMPAAAVDGLCVKSGTYSADAPRTRSNWRVHFLGGVALGALLLSASDPAYAACVTSGSQRTCSGDLSDGVVASGPTIEQLIIEDLTTNIAPAGGTEGVKFESNGAVTVNMDLGENSIEVSGANGIKARSLGGQAVSVTSIGDINAGGSGGGIFMSTAGSLTLDNEGGIESDGDAIHLLNESVTGSGGATSITQTGDLRSVGGHGIYSFGLNATTIDSEGSIHSAKDSIFVKAGAEGNVIVEHSGGKLTSDVGHGVNVSEAHGDVTIDVGGDIDSELDGIYAHSSGLEPSPSSLFLLEVDHVGRIDAGGMGIAVSSSNAKLDVDNEGEIVSVGTGIKLVNESLADNLVKQVGAITSEEGEGINVAGRGYVEIQSVGDIVSKLDALNGVSKEGSVEIIHEGSLTSSAANGVYADAANGTIDVTVSEGDISAEKTAIYAIAGGDIAVGLTGNITESATGIYAESKNGAITVTVAGDVTSEGDGVYAENRNAGKVKVEQAGILNVGGAGINAYSASGEVEIDQHGEITAGGNGIFAENDGDQAINIERTGDISSIVANGIYASSAGGAITIKSTESDLSVAQTGIYAESTGSSAVSIEFEGDITKSAVAISGYSSNGEVSIDTQGNLTASGDGIVAWNEGDAAVEVTHAGSINSGGVGISAASPNGAVTVDNEGTIESVGDAIRAANEGYQTVKVISKGGLTSEQGGGIYATSANGAVTVTSEEGDINVADTAIHAENFGSTAVTVDLTGNVTGSAKAIEATSANGAVTVTTIGDLVSTGDVITAANKGGGKITVDHAGDITSTAGNGVKVTATTTEVDIDIVESDIDVALTAILVETEGSELIDIDFDGNIIASTNAIVASSAVGQIDIDTKGSIKSTGDAITATNLGGQPINITHTGDLASTEGNAIVASTTDSDITVTLGGGATTALKDAVKLTGYADLDVYVYEDGTVAGGAGYAAINLEQGFQNSVTNYGNIRTAGTLSDYAIKATDSENIIDNYGTIHGSLDLGDWANAINNYEGAQFESGSVVKIGDDSVFTNAGNLSPGGEGTIQTTALTGSLKNTETGTLHLDLDMATGLSDRIDVSNTADLDGVVRLNVVDLASAGSTYTILTAANGIGVQNLTMVNPMLLYDINYTNNDTQVDLTINGFDFAPTGITGNGADIGSYLGRAVSGGSSDLYGIAMALLQMPTLEDVQGALNQLSPNVYLADQYASLFGAFSFADNLMSCKAPGGVAKFSAEGQCVWAKTGYRWLDRDGSDLTGFKDRTWDVSGGAQFAVDPDWRIGVAFGLTDTDRDMDGGATSEGNAVQFGAVVKYVPGPLLLAASLSGDYGWYDTTRDVAFGDISDRLEGSPEVGTLTGRLRAAYTFQPDSAYLKPQVDFNATYVRTSSFTESGGATAVHVIGEGDTVYSIAPSIEVGGQHQLANGFALRPFVRGGVTAYSDDDMTVTGRFAADTSGTDPFTISSSTDDVVWNVAAGMDAFATNGAALRVFYNGNFGEDTKENAVGLKFKMDY